MNYVHGDRPINQGFIPDNILTDVNDNANNNNIDNSSEKENNGVNSEKNARRVDEHNISESNSIVPIAVLNVVLLLLQLRSNIP